MSNVLVFDIETVPDVVSGRRIYELGEALPDAEAAKAMAHLRQQKTGSEFMPLHLHRIVVISVVLQTPDRLKVWSLGSDDSTEEADLVHRFFKGVEQYKPVLVSWNGTGFDLPVLHYRALLHGVEAPQYWEIGEMEQNFRYNNYLNRFHWRHLDLMDILSGYQARGSAPLEEIATMLGLPGKMGMHGSQVWEQFLAGELKAIRDYCETDALNTYLVYLHFEAMRGKLPKQEYTQRCKQLEQFLTGQQQAHFDQFLAAWQNRPDSGSTA